MGNITLVDLPGNIDRRTEVEVLMVSYIYNVCFKKAEKARFVIVISDNGFTADNGTEFI